MNHLKNPIILFPLPNTVFYPGIKLPLHIFEPRYRQMVEDASSKGFLIGMVLLKSGWDADYFGRPPVKEIGCAGRIDHCEKLPEGKFNIILEGLSRFRILEESEEKSYRLAEVDFQESFNDHSPTAGYDIAFRNLISQYEEFLESMPLNKSMGPRPQFQNCETVGQAMDQIAYSLDCNIHQKQAFLEERNVENRFAHIRSEIELKSQIMRVSSALKQSKIDTRLN